MLMKFYSLLFMHCFEFLSRTAEFKHGDAFYYKISNTNQYQLSYSDVISIYFIIKFNEVDDLFVVIIWLQAILLFIGFVQFECQKVE